MPLGREVDLGPGDIVLDKDLLPSPKRGQTPQFSAHMYCGKTAGWIKMTLSMEVGFGPGHIALDGDPAFPPEKRPEPPIFGPFLLWPNSWMDQHAIWYGGRPRLRRHCVRWEPSPLPKNGAQPPNFRHMSTVAKQLDGSRWHLARR